MTPIDPDASFVGDVLARTSGPACPRARQLIGGAPDEPVAGVDRELLEGHLADCAGCRAVADALQGVLAALPALADLDPGPGFTSRVLAATSGRPAGPTWWQRHLAWWTRAAARPRFAWEAAYVLTVALVLLFGDPLRAWDSATARARAWSPPAPLVDLDSARSLALSGRAAVAMRLDAAREWLQVRGRNAASLAAAVRRDSDVQPGPWARLVDAAGRWGRRALAWIDELLAAFRPPPTEPAGAPVRSSDRTETTR